MTHVINSFLRSLELSLCFGLGAETSPENFFSSRLSGQLPGSFWNIRGTCYSKMLLSFILWWLLKTVQVKKQAPPKPRTFDPCLQIKSVTVDQHQHATSFCLGEEIYPLIWVPWDWRSISLSNQQLQHQRELSIWAPRGGPYPSTSL